MKQIDRITGTWLIINTVTIAIPFSVLNVTGNQKYVNQVDWGANFTVIFIILQYFALNGEVFVTSDIKKKITVAYNDYLKKNSLKYRYMKCYTYSHILIPILLQSNWTR